MGFIDRKKNRILQALPFKYIFCTLKMCYFCSCSEDLHFRREHWPNALAVRVRDHLLNLSPLPSHPLLLLLSIYPPLSPLSCSWPKCKNRYPFVSAPRGNESVWIRLSVLSVAAKFLSPLTQLMTDTLTCTCQLTHYCTCAKTES